MGLNAIKNNTEIIELAKAYVALSNAHQLSLVDAMFESDASYHSANVGVFDGSDRIATMMQTFFAQHPDVYWAAQNYHCDSDQSVLFDFTMTTIHAETGETIQRQGVEQITFSALGLISRLQVSGK